MSTIEASALEAFQWERQPQAERFIREIVDDVLHRCTFAAHLAKRMKDETGTRFVDWIGHITLGPDDPRAVRAEEVGYVIDSTPEDMTMYEHPGGMFPTIVICELGGGATEIGIKTESVADFFAANGIDKPIEGEPLSPVRVAAACRCNTTMLSVIERHGSRSFDL